MAAFFVSLGMSCKFTKAERLSSKTEIDLLFEKGRILRHDALSMRWILQSKEKTEPKIRVLIAVPKRYVKLAVNRNRIKRQLREVHRLNKALWPTLPPGRTLAVGLIFLRKEPMVYQDLERVYKKLVEKFEKDLKILD